MTLHATRYTIRGFTLIEVATVMAIISILSGMLIVNFRGSGTGDNARNQTASVVLSDVRRMQTSALAGSTYFGKDVCGFGIHWEDTAHYLLFAHPVVDTSCSAPYERKYDEAVDIIIETKALINPNMEFYLPFADIYFEPPDPTTWIAGSKLPEETRSSRITIVAKGTSDPFTTIEVHTSGRVDVY